MKQELYLVSRYKTDIQKSNRELLFQKKINCPKVTLIR